MTALEQASREHVLVADPDLGAGLAADDLALARRSLSAPVVAAACGPLPEMVAVGDQLDASLGVLVLAGVLFLRVVVAGQSTTEVLGPGDVLRPRSEADGIECVPRATRWEAVAPTRLAVLDTDFARGLSPFPELFAALGDRFAQRSGRLGVLRALKCFGRVDTRLLVLLWHLADRWGTVGHEGVVVHLPLTHATLAELVGARRPSVTTALHALVARGDVSRRCDRSWVLHGGCPDWAAHPELGLQAV